MSNINTCTLSGNLTQDPELKDAGVSKVLKFGLAVDERRKTASGEWQTQPNYFDCTLFGQRGDSLVDYLHKGTKVTVSGRLRQSSWTDKNSGSKRSKVEVIVNDLDFGGGGRGSKPAQASFSASDIPF